MRIPQAVLSACVVLSVVSAALGILGGWNGSVCTAAEPPQSAARPELVVPALHSDSVRAIAFSPDGKRLATGSDDHTAILWDVETGRSLRVFEGHKAAICFVAFSADGKRLMTGSVDRAAIVWDVRTGRMLHSLPAQQQESDTFAAFSHDGNQVLTGRWSSPGATLWDIQTGKKLRTLQNGPIGSADCGAVSPDGTQILVASRGKDRLVFLWDAVNDILLRSFDCDMEVCCLAFSPDGKNFIAGTLGNQALVWETTGQKLLALEVSAEANSRIEAVAFGPDGKQVLAWAVGQQTQTAALFALGNGKKLQHFEGCDNSVTSLAFSPNGKLIAAGLTKYVAGGSESDNLAIIWDTQTGKQLHTMGMRIGYTISLSPDCQTVLIEIAEPSGAERAANAFQEPRDTNRDILWSTLSGKRVWTLHDQKDPFSICLSPDSRRIVSTISGGPDVLWNAETGRRIRQLDGSPNDNRSPDFAFSSDSKLLAGLGGSETIVWNAETGEKLRTLSSQDAAAQTGLRPSRLAFSPDDKQLLVETDYGSDVVWDVHTGKKLFVLAPPEGLGSAAFSPDGMQIVSNDVDATGRLTIATLWDAKTGKKLFTLPRGSVELGTASYRPDGKWLATGADANSVVLWNAQTGEKLRSLAGHDSEVHLTEFSPDGKFLLTSSPEDHVAILWNPHTGEKLRQLQFDVPRWQTGTRAFTPSGRAIRTAANDGSVVLLDPYSGERLARVIWLNAGRDWLAYTPDGHYDGSQRGRDAVAILVHDSEVVPGERFAKDFWRPGLLRDIAEGKRPK